MISKLKLFLLSISSIFIMSAPMALALPSPAYAAAPATAYTQTDINKCLSQGTDFVFDTTNGTCTPSNTEPGTNLTGLVTKIVNILSVIVGIVAVIMIIIGGFRYITSAGNPEGAKTARNTILYAIIGLVIVALAQIIVKFVLSNTTNTTA